VESDRASSVLIHQPKLAWQPLVSYPTIVQLIGATTTRTGLKVQCALDEARYPAGVKVSDAEMVPRASNPAPDEQFLDGHQIDLDYKASQSLALTPAPEAVGRRRYSSSGSGVADA